MSVNSMKVLAELVGVPEVIPHFDQCGESILMEVEDLLHSLVIHLLIFVYIHSAFS